MTDEMRDRWRQLRAKMLDNIKTHGQTLLGVFPTKDQDGLAFTYSIGLHWSGLPEFLVLGPFRGDFLNALASMAREQGRPFSNGETVSLGGQFPVKVVDAAPWVRDVYTIQVGPTLGDEDYRVQQVLVPDPTGKFADEPGCHPDYSVPVLTGAKQ